MKKVIICNKVINKKIINTKIESQTSSKSDDDDKIEDKIDEHDNIADFSYNTVVNNILDKRILELLKIISVHYPDKFPKNKIMIEFEFIKKNIEIMDTKPKPCLKETSKIKSKSLVVNKIGHKNDVLDRCSARIWNNIYDKETKKEISDVDKQFKIKDYNDIKIEEFNKRYKVGTQCRRKKTPDSIYCFQHKIHLPHGDYFEIPSNEICLHYMKDGNYL
jgi:hypothetical protein